LWPALTTVHNEHPLLLYVIDNVRRAYEFVRLANESNDVLWRCLQ